MSDPIVGASSRSLENSTATVHRPRCGRQLVAPYNLVKKSREKGLDYQ